MEKVLEFLSSLFGSAGEAVPQAAAVVNGSMTFGDAAQGVFGLGLLFALIAFLYWPQGGKVK